MRQRIAISGSAGVGKTTLARALAANLGLPCLGEGMREHLEHTRTDLHQLGRDGVRTLILHLWDERRAAEANATGGFVADRSSYDYAAFWLFYGYADQDSEADARFAEWLDPNRYDHHFVLPWGALPLEADGVRSPNRWVQLHVQLLVEGLLRPVGAAVLGSVPLADRVAEILERLRTDGSPGAEPR